MNLKKLSILITVCAMFVLLNTASAFATVDVAKARISRIGMIAPNATRGAMVELVDESGAAWQGGRQFFLSQEILGDSGLAIMLTGYSLGKTFWVRIADSEPLSLITIIYIND